MAMVRNKLGRKKHATKKKSISKRRSAVWFTHVRGSYLPLSWQGWLTYILYAAYLIFTVTVGWRDIHSATIAILYIVPNWIAATGLMTWVAYHKS
jgi:hypothetical protein